LCQTQRDRGRVLDPYGQPASQFNCFISGNGMPSPMFDAAPIMTGRSTTMGAGRFRYTNVTAGRYTVTAKRPADPPLWAQVQVDVSAGDVTGLELRLQPGCRSSDAWSSVAAHSPRPPNLAAVRVSIAPPTGSGGGMANQTNYGLGTSVAVNADEDGRFQIAGVIPGEYVVSSFIPGNATATGWWLQSAIVNGVDAVDLPVTIDGAVKGEIVLTFFRSPQRVVGDAFQCRGSSDDGLLRRRPFPADSALWRGAARRMKIARPSTAGNATCSLTCRPATISCQP
jgi:hypothetical protein